MAPVSLDANGEFEVSASSTSSYNDFDFYTGHWNIQNRKLKTRLDNCQEWDEFEATGTMRKILHGFGNTDNFIAAFDGKLFEGMALRIFNPETKLWSIYWTDTTRGTLDKPVIGSFDNNIGKFYCKDVFNGRDILMMFQWDKTDPEKPIWSQAFSPDNGKTWEWNWYMTFTRKKDNSSVLRQSVNVLELRNYLLKPSTTARFIRYFKDYFVDSQNALGAHVIGEFEVENNANRFFWIRGFSDMSVRGNFLPSFYKSPVWNAYGKEANEMIIDSDQVHLVRPLHPSSVDTSKNGDLYSNTKKLLVIDYYQSKDKLLDTLIDAFQLEYLPELQKFNLSPSLFITEMSENDFPRLPVIQDKNLLVVISSFADELEYKEKLKLIQSVRSKFDKAIQKYIAQKETIILNRVL